MDPSERMRIEWECVRLTQDFCYFIDQRRYEALAGLFAEDGVWMRHGVRLDGRAAIIEALQRRSAGQFTRHVTTGFHFTEVGADLARGVFYNISHFVFDEGRPPFIHHPENVLILDFEDRFEKREEGWRIAERLTRPVLLAPQLYDRLAVK